MIDPDVPLRVGNSGPEYNNHTPGRHWPGFFVPMAPSAHPTSSRCSSTGGRVREKKAWGMRLGRAGACRPGSRERWVGGWTSSPSSPSTSPTPGSILCGIWASTRIRAAACAPRPPATRRTMTRLRPYRQRNWTHTFRPRTHAETPATPFSCAHGKLGGLMQTGSGILSVCPIRSTPLEASGRRDRRGMAGARSAQP